MELDGETIMARNTQHGGKNNNPEGRNQYTSSWRETARDRPVATAAAAAAAVGASVFLWSRRNRISDQISNLSDQFSEWTGGQQFGGTQSPDSGEFEFADAGSSAGFAGTSSGGASQGIAGTTGGSGSTDFAGTTGSGTGASGGTPGGGTSF